MRKTLYNEINRLQTAEQPLFDADKERIMNHLKKEIKSRQPVYAVLKTLSAAAACFMLLLTACAFSPVLAESLPFMGEIVRFLNLEQLPRSGILAAGDAEHYMQPVNDTTEDALQITESYCDGYALVLSTELELPNTDETILQIIPEITVSANGQPLVSGCAGMYVLYRTEGDRFAGTLVLDIRELAADNTLDLSFTLDNLTGMNPKHMVRDESANVYAPKTYALKSPTVTHTLSIPVDNSLCRTYTVRNTAANFTVNTLITTPIATYLDAEYPEHGSYCIDIRTEDGTELSRNKFDNPDPTGLTHFMCYDPVPENTEKLVVSVYPWDNDTTPIGTVEIPVEFGYGTPADHYEVFYIPEEEIFYDPPMDTLTEFGPRLGEETVQLGETITSQAYRDLYLDPATGQQIYVNPNGKMDIIYSNMQVWASPKEAGLTQADMKQPEKPLQWDGCRFVTFDVQLITHGIYGLRGADFAEEIQTYEKKDETTGIMWITDFALPLPADLQPGVLYSDIAYFSGHMNGDTNYFHFAINEEDSRSFTVGFYVPDEIVESGEWMVGINTGEYLAANRSDFLGNTKYTYYDIPPVSLDE